MRVRVLLLFLATAALVLLPAGESYAATYEPGTWNVSKATWYGPGFYGNRTACGQTITRDTVGVAHKWLPCGHLVEFEWQGQHVVTEVIDRGPYANGAEWDLTEALCRRLSAGVSNRCMTWEIAWRL